MKLYEINERLDELLTMMEPDPETGEVADSEEIIAEILELQENKAEIHKWLAQEVLNARANAAAIDAEMERLKKLRERYAKRDERIVGILDRDCAEDEDYGFAKFARKKSKTTEVVDYDKAVAWLSEHNPECLRTKPVEVKRMEVKKLISKGTEVPGVEIQEHITASLR